MKYAKQFLFCAVLYLFVCCEKKLEPIPSDDYITWESYLGSSDRSHFTTLSQMTKENISKLELAWRYESDDWGQMQMNPLVVDSILYGVTSALRVIALNASTGKELWRYGDSTKVWHSTSRGVTYWEKKADKRIFCTIGSFLYALDAVTGEPIHSFGHKGRIDLRSGMPKDAANKFVISNTPGTIYKDLIIMPLRIAETSGAAPGDIMAFNVITGDLAWVFHTIPHPGEKGYDTWEDPNAYRSPVVGAANNWAGMALDEEREILYVPTGSAAPDFYGGPRLGSNLYANTLLALNANTGERLWHYQLTHHDIWDRDLPAPPNLLTVTRDGQKIPAVAQITKQGYVFVFNRITGEPLFDIEEVPVPESALEGENAWPTQPIPKKPKPFARLSQDINITDISPYATNKKELKELLTSSDNRAFAPPNLTPNFLLPGYDGGAEWGGAAAHPDKGILYVNSNEMPWILQMKKNKGIQNDLPPGESIYQKNCVACHQGQRQGVPESGFPSLVGLKERYSKAEASQIVMQGKGMMIGFPQISKNEMEDLMLFLFDEEIKHSVAGFVTEGDKDLLPYSHKGYSKFLDSNGHPGIKPPWGTLHAIDLNSGDYLWSIPFGETKELLAQGIKNTGTENYGGPVLTANGLLFIAATKDGYFRVFDANNGNLLWEYELPAAAFATPSVFEVNGIQYIAIACGGEKLGTKKGNQIIAFALKE